MTYFWPALDPPLGGSGRKNNNTCKGPWVLHPYQVSSKSIKRFWRRSWKCEKFTDEDGRTTTTTDGRRAMTIAHLSLWLRWAKNTNLVEDVKILLPVKFHQILFSSFREVEKDSANQRPGRPSCFSNRPEKHKLCRGRWDLTSCQVLLNSVQRFQRRSRKCEKLTTTDGRRRTDNAWSQ